MQVNLPTVFVEGSESLRLANCLLIEAALREAYETKGSALG